MVEQTISELRTMGKRRFLKTLAAMGVSGAALSHMSASTLASVTGDPEKRIPRLHYRLITEYGVEPVYYTIPRDEWERTEAAYDAGRTLAKRIAGDVTFRVDPSDLWIGVTTTSGRASEKAVLVEYQPELPGAGTESDEINRVEQRAEHLERSLPSEISGTAGAGRYAATVENIPVVVETSPRVRSDAEGAEVSPEGHGHFHHDYDPIPGGIRIDTSTACAPAEHPQLGDVLIGSGHAFDGDEGDTVEMVWDTVGTVEEAVEDDWTGAYSVKDYALIDVDSGNQTTGYLADDSGGTRLPIAGSVGKDFIEDIEGGSTEIHLQGSTTGIDSGTVHSIDVFENNFRTRANRAGGDSGGPHYWDTRNPSYGNIALIAGIHQGPYRRCPRFCNTYANATFWHHAVDEFDLEHVSSPFQ